MTMQCKAVTELPKGSDWTFEIKFTKRCTPLRELPLDAERAAGSGVRV